MTYGITYKKYVIDVESCTKWDQNTSDMADHIGEVPILWTNIGIA